MINSLVWGLQSEGRLDKITVGKWVLIARERGGMPLVKCLRARACWGSITF